jgi:hypothetical protein
MLAHISRRSAGGRACSSDIRGKAMPRDKYVDDTVPSDQAARDALRAIRHAVNEREYEPQRRNDRRVGEEHGPQREGIVPVPTRVRDELHPDRERYRLIRWTDL